MVTSLMRVERRYLNGQMPIAPGGWCWCCWCHCSVNGALETPEESEEL